MDAAKTSIRTQLAEIRSHTGEGYDPEAAFEEGVRTLIQALEIDAGKPTTLNLKQSAEMGDIGALYFIYRMLSEHSAHPTFSSLRLYTEVLREENGNWKIILGEPEFSDYERCDTLNTTALAMLGVAVSAREALGISGLISEIEEIHDSWPNRSATVQKIVICAPTEWQARSPNRPPQRSIAGAQPTGSATNSKPPLCGINRPSHLVPSVRF